MIGGRHTFDTKPTLGIYQTLAIRFRCLWRGGEGPEHTNDGKRNKRILFSENCGTADFFPRSFLQIRVRMMQHIECIVKLNSNQAGRSASWQRLCFKVGLAVAGVD